jgi:hypothetical protein
VHGGPTGTVTHPGRVPFTGRPGSNRITGGDTHLHRRGWTRDALIWICAVALAATSLASVGYPKIAQAAATPLFVQQVSAHSPGATSLTVPPVSSITAGDRLVVEVGMWSSAGATAASVADSAGNSYVELLHFKASDATELSVWTAPITAGGGTRPTITVRPTSAADTGMAVLEYAGLSTVSDSTVVDQMAHASGGTAGAALVASGATAATTAGNELALGFYNDSGFGDSLGVGPGYTGRVNVSSTSDMEFVAEEQLVSAGATPNATVSTGAGTTWEMATVVFKAGVASPPTAPSAPTGVTASAGNASATVSWTAPSNGGSPITSYTVTPYVGATAQPTTTVSGSPPATSATIGGLVNGTTYTFTVAATNSVGTGATSSSSNAVTPGIPSGGQWSSLITWPIVAVHSILLPNGQFLLWDGWQQPQPTQLWNPTTQAFTTISAPDSIFCSGSALLPDGRVIEIGGYGGLSTGNQGIVDTSIFDPATSTWTRVADMHMPRWYPDLLELADGRYVAISGMSSNSATWADTPEVYDPAANTWTALSAISTSQVHEEEYPFSYLSPDGRVFTIGASEDLSFLLNVTTPSWAQVGGASGLRNGSSVMYRPGKILYSGGADSVISVTNAKSSTAVIDLTAATPTWRQTAPMGSNRIYHTLTMLADGNVLAVGGEPTSDQGIVSTGVLPTEIWNPTTETWSPGAPIAAARNYHSTGVLMPDGRVLVAGGGHTNGRLDPGQYSAQIYSPAYLFKGARPTIGNAPGATTNGANVSITTPDAASITAVNLVSLGADTHQADMNQRFVPLSFATGSGTLNAQIPSAGTAPPGNYMLFIVNAAGVPSVASFIRIAAAQTAPAAPTGVNAAAGNASATVTWTAPANGGSPITSYQVVPFIGSIPQSTTTVSGSPPPTRATIGGLANGTAYTFTVTAINAIGPGPPSSPSNTVTPGAAAASPSFVQQVSAHRPGASSLAVTPAAPVGPGNRLLVEVGMWSNAGSTAASVSDSAGNHYVELLHFKAPDATDMSVWTAPITAGGGTRPTITVQPTSAADTGMAVLEYAGLSPVSDSTVVDQMAHAFGTTGGAALVASGATAATTAGNELALGFYNDSGFGDSLGVGPGYTGRVNVSSTSDMEFVAEEQLVSAGATPNATVSTGAGTTWEMATVVFKAGVASPPTAPSAPTGVTASAGNASATVSWTAPSNGGSPITSYVVTPYVGATAQPTTTVSGSPPATSATIGGLVNGTTYTFTVAAANAVGTGPASAQSNGTTPTASPIGPIIDGSTPSMSSVAPNVTTAVSNAFSPPAATIIEAAFAMDSYPTDINAHVAGVTNTGSALTWHLKGAENRTGTGVGGFVEVWWAYNPAAQANITVTGNFAQPTKNVAAPVGALQVIVLRNAAADQSAAAWTSNADVTAGSPPTDTVTTTAANSLVLAVANNWDTSQAPVVPGDQTTTLNAQTAVVLNPTDQDTYWVQVKGAITGIAGAVTMNDTAPSVRYHMIAWEIRSA